MKKVFVFAALLIVLATYGQSHYNYRENTWLQQRYALYNDVYFDGELPRDTPVMWKDIPKDEHGNFIMGNTHVDLIHNTFSIQIDTKTNIASVTAAETELHEMCHVRVDTKFGIQQDQHGPLFQACMDQLARDGAFTGLW